MVSIVSLLIVVALSLLVMRIATMALMVTGLSRESAQFQARSAFTGVGFTTSESESIVSHPVRRRIVMLLMLLGNLGIATVVASAVLSIVTTSRSERWWLDITVLLAGIAILSALSTNRWVEHRINQAITWGLRRWTKLEVQDYVALLQLQSGYAVTEIAVEPSDWLDGKSLREAALSHEGILVLGIERHDGSYLGSPGAEDEIHAGDVLVLYGLIRHLEELDQRSCGVSGEEAHCAAMAQHQETLSKVNGDSPGTGPQ